MPWSDMCQLMAAQLVTELARHEARRQRRGRLAGAHLALV